MKESQAKTDAGHNPPGRKQHPTIVVDTNILLVASQPYQIDELKALAPAHYVVPATVLSELDKLKSRPETRDKARAALNVLKSYVKRGAIPPNAVSCGSGSTLRIARREEEAPQPWLDMGLADDRILALCVNLASRGKDVKLATVEFALFAKAATADVEGLYLDRYAEPSAAVTRRERGSLRDAWNRVQAADSCWSICRRGLWFLQKPLVRRLTDTVRQTGDPPEVALVLARFASLESVWGDQIPLDTIMERTLGIAPPPQVNYAVSLIHEPTPYVLPSLGGRTAMKQPRNETPEEHVLRIRAEESQRKAWEDHNVDTILSWLEVVRDYILDQVGDDVG